MQQRTPLQNLTPDALLPGTSGDPAPSPAGPTGTAPAHWPPQGARPVQGGDGAADARKR